MKSKEVTTCEEPTGTGSHDNERRKIRRQEGNSEQKPRRPQRKSAFKVTYRWLREANRRLVEQAALSRQQVCALEMQKAALEQANRRLEALNNDLAAQAVTDGLTGLRNHRAFQEQLALAWEQSVRYRHPLSLVLLDVDHFKAFNDTFGHPAGDAALCKVATVLQACARTTDFVARYGGEEFVLLLPETDAEGAVRAAERIRAALAEQAWEYRAITVSGGVATCTPDLDSPAALLETADKALYAAKAAGRNRVTHLDASVCGV